MGFIRRLRVPRPATPLSILAIVLAVAGTATAAGLIDSADVKNNSLTGKDIKNKSLTKKDFKGSITGPRGPAGQNGATGPTGSAGSAVAYAHINSNGTLDAANSKNITATKLYAILGNYYCIDVSVPVHNAVATLDGISPGQIVVIASDPFTSCGAPNAVNADFTVQTFDKAGTGEARAFYIAFN